MYNKGGGLMPIEYNNIFYFRKINSIGRLRTEQFLYEIAKKYKAKTVLDAAQGYGIIDVNSKNVDFIVFAGHKSLYGPFGIGGFINNSQTIS